MKLIQKNSNLIILVIFPLILPLFLFLLLTVPDSDKCEIFAKSSTSNQWFKFEPTDGCSAK